MGIVDNRHGLIQGVGLFVQVAGFQTHLDTGLVTLNGKHRGTSHGCGQRLSTAHPSQTTGKDPATFQITIIVLSTRFYEGFVSALYNALRANVNPRTGRHLAIHHQAFFIEFVKRFPVGPMRHKV